jgi:heme-degrading monooxygenase HmoA
MMPRTSSSDHVVVLCCSDGLDAGDRGVPVRLYREGRIMFASIRKYNVRRGSADELARRVREGFVPMMRQIDGFRGYYLLDGGPDVLITISIFDSADEAFASNEKAADWVRNNVLEFTKGMPEVMVGNALIAEVK